MIELLSPAGNFDSVKAAVQNGADAIYFGGNQFNARTSATNFDLDEMEKVIEYCKIRGVKTNLTLNTLVNDKELTSAIDLAKHAYILGVDAIIVQDLGLSQILIRMFPDLPIHASTQMSIYSLNGVIELQNLGFKRVVLSRELSLAEISNISANTNIEIECFVHGALCVSYSGQCLFSSLAGGRSGNRGKCAQPCRLPYHLLENDQTIDAGYLLNTKDFCAIDFIPKYIKAGVKCLKIEGRMKSPEYVATVTRIYRKYIDLAYSKKEYIVEESDRKELLQAFNRGGFSSGHLEEQENKNLVFPEKPNNMGLFLGFVSKFDPKKGHITFKANETFDIGDTISFGNEKGSYTVSEIMKQNQNMQTTNIGDTYTIGRMKGTIKSGDKIYKISSKAQLKSAQESYIKENKKVLLNCKVSVRKDMPISINITPANKYSIYKNLNIHKNLDIIPEISINKPLDPDIIKKQINKTTDTPFQFKNVHIDLDDNLFLPKISALNELRRLALSGVEDFIKNNIKRIYADKNTPIYINHGTCYTTKTFRTKKISVLLNKLHNDFDYTKLENVDNIYIHLKYFLNKQHESILLDISKKYNVYIYLPPIIKDNYKNLFIIKAISAVQNYQIKGFVISNLCNIKLLNNVFNGFDDEFKIVANYTFNIFNHQTIYELKQLGITSCTISPESNNEIIQNLCSNKLLDTELIIYGNIPIMTMNYCVLGKSNKCYPDCSQKCKSSNIYYLKDRLNMKFRVSPDSVQSATTLYNSKTLSICPNICDTSSVRIDILDETIDEINHIINTVKSGNRLEGNTYTNGNTNREI